VSSSQVQSPFLAVFTFPSNLDKFFLIVTSSPNSAWLVPFAFASPSRLKISFSLLLLAPCPHSYKHTPPLTVGFSSFPNTPMSTGFYLCRRGCHLFWYSSLSPCHTNASNVSAPHPAFSRPAPSLSASRHRSLNTSCHCLFSLFSSPCKLLLPPC